MIGLVEIYKESEEGIEKIYSDNNLITIGLGYSLAAFFSTQDINRSIADFQIGMFQLGTSTVGYATQDTSTVRYFYNSQTPVPGSSLGTDLDATVQTLRYLKSPTNFNVSSYLSSVELSTDYISLIEISNSQKSINGDDSVTHRLFLEKNIAPNIGILELGLYIKNPDSAYKIDRPMLAAYKKLPVTINKNTNFKLIIDWTIKFKDY